LRFALELRQYKIPTVYSLNLSDVAKRRGITVNEKLLSLELGAPVIPTVAVKKQGINELLEELKTIMETPAAVPHSISSCGKCSLCANGDIWAAAKEISRRVTKKENAKPNFIDRLGENMMKPISGIPIAFLVMALLIGVVFFGGEALREFVLLPLVDGIIVPFFRWLFALFIPEGVFLNILTGEFGIFVISFEWIFALIFPFVLFFYIGFSFLEDSGYLPRISVLFDNVMRKLGVQGGSLIYIFIAFGCAVPAIIGTRAATSRKERIVTSTAICFAIPCVSQTGALIALLSAYSWRLMFAMILFGFAFFAAVSLIAARFVKGTVDPLILEIPNLLMPEPKAYAKKILTRMKHFLKDAEVPMMIAVIIAAVLAESGLLELIAAHTEILVSKWLGMPREAVIGLILGIVRREMAVVPLLELELTALQAFVGGAIALMYIPCLSVFAVLVKEFKLKIALGITFSTIFVALFIGGLINQIGQLF
jgi:ferrous iron transport protein B